QVWEDTVHPPKDVAREVALHLAKHGFNIMRLGTTEGDIYSDSEWDNFTYFIQQLKENGINVSLQIMAGTKYTGLLFDDSEIDDHKQWIKDGLLLRENPNGMLLAEDPVIAMLEITNEDSYSRYYLENSLNYNIDGNHSVVGHTYCPLIEADSTYLDHKFSGW
ncbi:hypothetical protein KA005_32270, partial [bacterium]|nr:hypothetical protein [bacterium]